MYRDGHIGVALLSYSPVVYWLVGADQLTTMALGLAGVVAGCTLPDLDMQIPGLKHRGLSHSLVAAIVMGVGYAVIGVFLATNGYIPVPSSIIGILQAGGFAFAIGSSAVVLHLLGDVLTPMGIRPWQPWSERKYTLEVTTAASSTANTLLYRAGAGAFVVAIVVGYGGLDVLYSVIDPFIRVFT